VERVKRRRWAVGTVAVVLGLCALVLVVSWVAAPDSPTGYGAAAESVIVDACTRARGGEGREGCRCAYDRLAAEVPWDRAVELDEGLGRGEPLPPEIAELVAGCWERRAAEAPGT
jgi:hypothetical protein